MSPKQQIEAKLREIETDLAKAHVDLLGADQRAAGFQEAMTLLGEDVSSANVRAKLEEKIKREKKQALDQVSKLEAKLSAFEDTLKLMEKENAEPANSDLRPNSDVFRIREFLRISGKPMNLSEILVLMEKPDTTENKNNIRGSIGRYAREGRIFVQTGPNTYGLVELGHKAPDLDDPV